MPLFALVGFVRAGECLRRHNPARFEPVVQCSQGHRYHSVWLPPGSLNAVRWFGRRYQWCPVGHHWSWTRRLEATQLSADERRAADAVHDLRIA